jgi:hypothetical protein
VQTYPGRDLPLWSMRWDFRLQAVTDDIVGAGNEMRAAFAQSLAEAWLNS